MSYPPSAQPTYYSATPPAPPPKPSPNQGPPLPPPPPGQNEPLELDGGQGQQYQQQYRYQGQQAAYQQQHPQQQQPNIPPIELGWLPDIVREKTTSDLHDLLNNTDLQTSLLTNPTTTHPAIKTSTSHLPTLLQTNINQSTALSNLETRLQTSRAQTQSRLLALRALEQQHRAKISETEDALSHFSPMALYQRLSGSVTEQELLVRGVEESWLDEGGVAGEREVEAWLRRVKEVSKVAFLRRERRDRWDEGRVGGWR